MMSVLSQNFRKLNVALISCLLTLLFQILSHQAIAQDSTWVLAGACIPHSRDQGPWDCKAEHLLQPKCLDREKTGYDAAWKLVRNNDEAAIFLKAVYSYYNNSSKFAQWLACQGFYIDLTSIGAGGFHQDSDYRLVWVRIGFLTKGPRTP